MMKSALKDQPAQKTVSLIHCASIESRGSYHIANSEVVCCCFRLLKSMMVTGLYSVAVFPLVHAATV